ncbi:hypothetical protein Ade02nite_58330 [Paractinoplanes deccanensis]|uniref:Uncharacterized protein n=1 Tax=Paractinoplanes deccanensis TaxID=113561 RepID=A0ABQ3YAY5_9ACTN|nr:hypothetical protein [Actinoplanes deccanensis]GID77192.1 hypothetical protein Ade02nite_58330 [Actinoplanes deccanensis]
MGQPTSDAAFELVGACVHSLRFAFGAPLRYPYAPTISEEHPPPAIFRRLQAVSPPPGRGGGEWYEGMTLDDKPFRPNGMPVRLDEVRHEEGIPSLDGADPDKVVLDSWFRVPRRAKKMFFPGPDRGRYLLSIGYWSPIPPGATETEREVAYYDEYRMNWSRRPEGQWVAVSFDAFYPPERDSADLIIPIGDCDDSCPRS